MKKLIALLVVALSLNSVHAVDQTPPPDFNNDIRRSGFGSWENKGQVKDTGGDLRSDVQYVTGGTWSSFSAPEGELILVGLEGQHLIDLFDASGRLVLQRSIFAQEQGTSVPKTTGLAPGSYVIRVDGRSTRKVVVR